MTGRAVPSAVSVYDVGDAGTTGPMVGTGLLLEPDLVLVHRRLGRELADGGARALRVGVSSGGDAGRIAEVIDVAQILVSPAATDEPVVALALRTRSVSPIDPLAPAGGGDRLSAVLAYLDAVDDPALPLPAPPIHNDERMPWCGVWPNGPGC